jgi:hypothetical protein
MVIPGCGLPDKLVDFAYSLDYYRKIRDAAHNKRGHFYCFLTFTVHLTSGGPEAKIV